MRIGTRITLTTSALVALILGTYGFFTLRSRRAALEAQITGQARELAATLRVLVENRDPADWPTLSSDLQVGLVRAGVPWQVALLDTRSLPGPDAPPTGAPRTDRLRRMVVLRTAVVELGEQEGRRTLVHLEPVRVPAPFSPDGFRIIGAVEVSRDMSHLEEADTDEGLRIAAPLVLLIGILVLAIILSTRRAIGRPIEKLIAGIDDVAKGDLSHVLLQERDDEIGALAARFNEMTRSLRDARAEARRGVEERLALEAKLRGSAQLATIGQLAAEIAHEVGTPLNVVTGRARALAKKADDAEAVQKNATIIAEQATRITRIIQRLLDVARRKVGAAERGPIDMNKLAADALELLEYQLAGSRIEARSRLAMALPAVAGEKDQLQQVLLNLYMNAIQAMPGGGALEVRTSRVDRRRPGLEVAPEQPYVVLEVADTGTGIPEKERAKIFEAFYTSKGDSGGSGLGLAVAHGIVKDHDGWVELDDNQAAGQGTVFRVYLPAAGAEGRIRTAEDSLA